MKRFSVIATVAFVIAGGHFGKQITHSVVSSDTPTEQQIAADLAEGFVIAAKKLNDNAPMTIDEETRMDKAIAGPGALLTYEYTLVNFTSRDVSREDIETSLFTATLEQICPMEEMKASLQLGAKFAYSYSGYDGRNIGRFTIDRKDCGLTFASN